MAVWCDVPAVGDCGIGSYYGGSGSGAAVGDSASESGVIFDCSGGSIGGGGGGCNAVRVVLVVALCVVFAAGDCAITPF